MGSFAEAISNRRNENIYLVRGGRDQTGKLAWYFIRVENLKTKLFLRAIQAGNLDLDFFGTVLESGYGEQPPESVLSYMRANYNFAA